MPTANFENFKPYKRLVKRFRQIALLQGTAHLLEWDQETSLPPRGTRHRAEQIGQLYGLIHKLATSEDLDGWLKQCEEEDADPESKGAANVRSWRRDFDRQARLPRKLVERFRRLGSLARESWVEARLKKNFALFEPHLTALLDLAFQMAEHWGYEETPYNAFLEEYEPGLRAKQLEALFPDLEGGIRELLGPAVARTHQVPAGLLKGDYPVAQQQQFNARIARAVGFDFQAGRIDTTVHPFCTTLGPADCRLTTRYDPEDFTVSLYGVLHEAGHGLYEQGLSKDDFGLPAGAPVSLGIHESQSRLWENKVGTSLDFWRHWIGPAAQCFPQLKALAPEQIYWAVNRVEPSLIRVEADELTYDLHIILRFRLEQALFAKRLAPRDLPGAWNELTLKLLGLQVPDDTKGCLQDIHWSLGSFGYFPTYTLGNLNSAQLFAQAGRDHPGLEQDLRKGVYRFLLKWLKDKVHQQGKRYWPQDLMKRITGQPTSFAPHLAYLREKFSAGG